ncbi:MAG: hypothetical protein IPL79_08530 [Myxococcales bacterium]|nr:hypothetical protein [Myxococcales bacterium]
MRWQAAPVTETQAQFVLDELERSWAIYTEEFGHSAPYGSDTYRMNVYISNATDTPAIEDDNPGGYAASDDEGYPYFVMNIAAFDSGNDWVRGIIAHELYHDFQISLGGFEEAHSWWFWEASADWATQEVFPDDPLSYFFVGVYALTEDLPIFYMGDPWGDDALAGNHQYGASVFLKYLTDTKRDRQIVIDTWEQGKIDDDALRVVLGQVAARADEASDLYGEFAAHTVHWDMVNGPTIASTVQEWEAAYPDRLRADASIDAQGTGWASVRAGSEVRAFGHNLIELARPSDGELVIALRMQEAPLAVEWRPTLVRMIGGQPTYTEVPIIDGMGHINAYLGPDEAQAWLVVAAIADTRDAEATFGYEFRVGEPPPESSVGCAASRQRDMPYVIIVVLGAYAFARRRRPTRHPRISR